MAGLCNALEEGFPSEKLTSKFDRKFLCTVFIPNYFDTEIVRLIEAKNFAVILICIRQKKFK